MPRRRRTEKRDRLDFWQRWQLLTGHETHGPGGPSFEDEDDAAQAWEDHRDAVMQFCRTPVRRPAAYYKFDLGITMDRFDGWDPRTGDARPADAEAIYLAQHDLLTDDEITYLRQQVAISDWLAILYGPALEIVDKKGTANA